MHDAYAAAGVSHKYLSQASAKDGCEVAKSEPGWHTGGTPPLGAVLFWENCSAYGHVAISKGGGMASSSGDGVHWDGSPNVAISWLDDHWCGAPVTGWYGVMFTYPHPHTHARTHTITCEVGFMCNKYLFRCPCCRARCWRFLSAGIDLHRYQAQHYRFVFASACSRIMPFSAEEREQIVTQLQSGRLLKAPHKMLRAQ